MCIYIEPCLTCTFELMKAFMVETFALTTCAQLCFNVQHSESFHKHSKNDIVLNHSTARMSLYAIVKYSSTFIYSQLVLLLLAIVLHMLKF